MKPTDELIS